MATLSLMAGSDSLRSMVRWCEVHRESLNLLLGTNWRSAPSLKAWHNLMGGLGANAFENALVALPAGTPALHLDGKALRGSEKGGGARQYLTSVFQGLDSLVIDCVPHGPGGELEAAQKALARLASKGDLKGVWLTFDALHTQKKR
jgi:hypothetical protein